MVPKFLWTLSGGEGPLCRKGGAYTYLKVPEGSLTRTDALSITRDFSGPASEPSYIDPPKHFVTSLVWYFKGGCIITSKTAHYRSKALVMNFPYRSLEHCARITTSVWL